MPVLAPILSLQSATGRFYDADARAFFATAGVTDAAAKKQISDFVKGAKALGIWSSMVCWSMRSAQNAGTGTTVYSLGGLGVFNGTLVDGPTWGTGGIDFSALNTMRMTTGIAASQGWTDLGIIAVYESATSQSTGAIFGNRSITQNNFAGLVLGNVTNGLRVKADLSSSETLEASAINGFVLAGAVRQSAGTYRLFAEGVANNYSGSISYPTQFALSVCPSTSQHVSVWRVAFAAAFNGAVPNAETAFRELYKSTLGQGLGLQ